MRVTKGLVAGLWAILLAAPAMGQDLKALEQRLKDQERRIAELEALQSDQRLKDAQKEEVIKLINEINADAAKKGGSMPSWLKDLKFKGDFRLRYEGQSTTSAADAVAPKDRNRARFRLRFGFIKTFLDKEMEVGFRLASGDTSAADGRTIGSGATSTNQTMTDFFSEKSIWIDLAYAKYTPKAVKGLTIIGGKMATPLVHTDLVWDSDVNPEGFFAQYEAPFFGDVKPFVSTGYFLVQESGGGHDTILVTYQAGVDWAIAKDVGGVLQDLGFTTALAYYDYDHMNSLNTGAVNATRGNMHRNGSDLLARKFQMINWTTKMKFKALGLKWSPYFDIVHNCGNEDVDPRFDNQSNGFALGFNIGENKKKGDWSLGYKYARIESNCTVGAFNDSDFGHNNRKGHVFRGTYNLTDDLTIGASFFWTEPVTTDPSNGLVDDQRTCLLQADLVWKF